MKRVDIEKLFPDATTEQIDALLNINSADIGRAKGNTEALKNELAELKEVEKELDTLKKAQMTEKEQYELLIKQAEMSKSEYETKANRLEVEKMFVAAGFDADEYETILDGIVSSDIKQSKAVAENILNVFNNKSKALDKSIRAELLENTPKAEISEGEVKPMTKDKFNSMTTQEQIEYIEQNPNWQSEIK